MHVQPTADPHPFAFALLDGAELLGLERCAGVRAGQVMA